MNFVSFIGPAVSFALGTFVGSFLNVVSDRVDTEKNMFFGRSECDFCKKQLSFLEMVPVLSFLFQKGHCKRCQEKLSLLYPISEFLTGISYIVIFVWLNMSVDLTQAKVEAFIFYLVIASFLIIILLTDIKFMIIPDKIVFPAIIFVILFKLYDWGRYSYNLYSSLIADDFGKYLIKAGYLKNHILSEGLTHGYTLVAALAISLFFLFLIFITKGRGMGGGDVKLGFLIGLIAGFPLSIVALFASFVFGALYSVGLVVIKRKTIKDAIPFGPFLILGCIFSLFFGSQLLDWYLKIR